MMKHDTAQDVHLKPACAHLRHKLMYADERHQVRGMVDDNSDTRIFFCAQSGDCLGPDQEASCPSSCNAGRACFEPGRP